MKLLILLILLGELAEARRSLVSVTVRTERCETVVGGVQRQRVPSPISGTREAACTLRASAFSVFGKCPKPDELAQCRFQRKMKTNANGELAMRLPAGDYYFTWGGVQPPRACSCELGPEERVSVAPPSQAVTLRLNCRCDVP